jgi:hypothetical protein
MPPTLTASWLLPPDETARLATLRRYADESCLHEPVITGFLDLAARIFNVPIAFLTLVDADEVVHKVNNGQPVLARRPRTGSICALVIRHNTSLVFTDLAEPAQRGQLTDAAALAVQALGIRFYAGFPLRMPDQRPIGTLCLIGYQARDFGPDEERILAQLAALVQQTMAIRQVCLASSWLGEGHWSRIQTTLTEGIWDLAALVRYLLQRSEAQVPMPAEVLEPVARRLAVLYSGLAMHPASLL